MNIPTESSPGEICFEFVGIDLWMMIGSGVEVKEKIEEFVIIWCSDHIVIIIWKNVVRVN